MSTHHGRTVASDSDTLIVRILGEGQLQVPVSALDELNQLDDEVQSVIHGGDQEKFGPAMAALLDRVRALGQPLPLDEIRSSDLILPGSDSSLDEVRDLLSDDGLIPG